MKTLLLYALDVTLLASLGSSCWAAESSCVSCHEKEAAIERHAVHLKAGIRCVDCHGGDPSEEDKAAAKAKGTKYLGKITKTKVPGLCGNCHADVRRMNPYGIPTDQLAQYRVSHHGEALFDDGNLDVAVCSDCHNAHGVLAVRDPQSPVYPKNVPDTCGRCHSDAKLMAAHDLKANQKEKYLKSVHADLLWEKGDLSAPTCVTCHGNHGAVPPGFAKVGQVCGKCHVREKEFFDKSPHAVPASEDEFETCVTCHSNHEIHTASESIFKRCKLCHDPDDDEDKAYTIIEKVQSVLSQSSQHFEEISKKVKEAEIAGLHTDDEQVLEQEAKTYLTQLAPLQHSLDVKKLIELEGQVTKTLDQIDKGLKQKMTAIRRRKLALIPIGIFMVLMSLGFSIKLKQLEH